MFKSQLPDFSTELIPFVMAGYPTLEASEIFIEILIANGVDILEVGVPFSDPMADGPVIQMASEKALHQGTTLKKVLSLCQKITRKYPTVRLIIFSYLNPLLAYGLETYVKEAAQSGIAATLTVDLPPEEAKEYLLLHSRYKLLTVFLASPMTSVARLPLINQSSSGFVYYVSRAGVTGEQAYLSSTLISEIKSLRNMITQPIAVGFGISQVSQVSELKGKCEAVVIGSALIRLISESNSVIEAQRQLGDFTKLCLNALKHSG